MWEPPQYAPAPILLCGSRSASRRRADRNVAVGSYSQYVPTLIAAAAWRLNAEVSKVAWWPWPLTFDLESDVRVICDVGYLCANFSLPIALSLLDLGPMNATDVRQRHRLMPPPIRGGGIIIIMSTFVTRNLNSPQMRRFKAWLLIDGWLV